MESLKQKNLLKKQVKGEAEIYHYQEGKTKQGIVRTFYKHLMNGISHALPFAVASGVLYGILYLLQDYVLTYQILTLTSYVQQLATIMIVPVVSAYIADSIADRPGMVGIHRWFNCLSRNFCLSYFNEYSILTCRYYCWIPCWLYFFNFK